MCKFKCQIKQQTASISFDWWFPVANVHRKSNRSQSDWSAPRILWPLLLWKLRAYMMQKHFRLQTIMRWGAEKHDFKCHVTTMDVLWTVAVAAAATAGSWFIHWWCALSEHTRKSNRAFTFFFLSTSLALFLSLARYSVFLVSCHRMHNRCWEKAALMLHSMGDFKPIRLA